ncbi:MAG TPA: hypothetical protein VHN11_16525 [Xanthobacteraceae bacterium]|nr:hypothetical protein [Xanthobacteraceae bacterium]
MTTDALTDKALRSLADLMAANRADLKDNQRQMVVDVERHHELMDREKLLMRLYQMHGGRVADVLSDAG